MRTSVLDVPNLLHEYAATLSEGSLQFRINAQFLGLKSQISKACQDCKSILSQSRVILDRLPFRLILGDSFLNKDRGIRSDIFGPLTIRAPHYSGYVIEATYYLKAIIVATSTSPVGLDDLAYLKHGDVTATMGSKWVKYDNKGTRRTIVGIPQSVVMASDGRLVTAVFTQEE